MAFSDAGWRTSMAYYRTVSEGLHTRSKLEPKSSAEGALGDDGRSDASSQMCKRVLRSPARSKRQPVLMVTGIHVTVETTSCHTLNPKPNGTSQTLFEELSSNKPIHKANQVQTCNPEYIVKLNTRWNRAVEHLLLSQVMMAH